MGARTLQANWFLADDNLFAAFGLGLRRGRERRAPFPAKYFTSSDSGFCSYYYGCVGEWALMGQ
jgi:hypothetical protein